MSHQGKILYFQDNQEAVRARIYDFDIAKAILKPKHLEFLQNRITPILQSGGSLRLIGLASRTGDPSFNRFLSVRRRDTVLNFLRAQARNNFVVARSEAQGEDAARLAGVPDCQEHENWRSVIISAWTRPIPPPEHIEIPVQPPLMVSRFMKRSWLGISTSRLNSREPGENFAQAGELALRVSNPDAVERDSRRAMVREDYLINSIRISKRTEASRLLGVSMAETETYTIDYEWGVPAQTVRFRRYDENPIILTREQARPFIERPGYSIFRMLDTGFPLVNAIRDLVDDMRNRIGR